MNNSVDLRWLLDQWPFDSAKNARLARGSDGREILQVRLPLGLEQYEMEGRPDGQRPEGCESWLNFQLHRLAAAKTRGEGASFGLTEEECKELFDEGMLFYYRYLHLFQLRDWKRTIRDTGRNLQLFDLVKQYADRDEDRRYLEQWRPYVLRINAAAQAMAHVENRSYAEAFETAQSARTTIEALPEMENDVFRFERQRALTALGELTVQIQHSQPLSKLQQLERELRQAIETQAFEVAAKLRDEIRALRAPPPAR
jgi:hypothetical protein